MQQTVRRYSITSLWFYIPLWLFFVYLYIQILAFDAADSHNIILSGMYFIQFGVHEASHIVFGFLPAIFVAAAGSVGEVAFTVLVAAAGFKLKAYFAAIFGCLWVMLAMNSAGRYMADARSQLLPLIGPSDTPTHDWNFVFGQLGWLQHDIVIGTIVRVSGDVIGALALIFGLFMLVYIVLSQPLKK
jgi:hypothetical protein